MSCETMLVGWKSGKCRRRKFQTLGLIAVIVLLYFLLQFFTLSKLGRVQSGRKNAHHSMQQQQVADEHHEGIKISADETGHENNIVKDDFGEESFNHDERSLIPAASGKKLSLPRGVHSSNAERYTKNAAGLFKCFESEMQIHIGRVNDDYCDCPDSSDEPGTSACPNAKFYCKIQLPHREAQFVHSSKVNDGICDCCDGSDEWEGRLFPDYMEYEGQTGAVFHTPCTDRCGDVRKAMADEERIHQQGVQLQETYLAAAQNLSAVSRQRYGPSGIFYLLSTQCFKHTTQDYLYTVCPFVSVKQSSGHMSSTVLGLYGHWKQKKPGNYILTMNGGDSFLCPDGHPRQTQVHFLCGLEDRVIDVVEDEKCRYVVRFSSPAAC